MRREVCGEVPFMEYNKKQKIKMNANSLPSPDLTMNSPDLAQDPNYKSAKKNIHSKRQRFNPIKGASPCTSPGKKVAASMTVEAALVLPLFLIFFLNIGSIMEILRFHSKMETALWEVGRETCIYGTALTGVTGQYLKARKDEGKGSAGQLLETMGNLALSYTYVKGRVEEYLGEAYIDGAPIRGGRNGLQYVGGSVWNDEDVVEMVVTYVAEPKWLLPGFRRFLMENHYYGRLWTGYALGETDNVLYYLAENPQVFHRDGNCSHLKLNPELTRRERLGTAVNSGGSHYRACSICAKGEMPEEIWISPEGDCYHFLRECPGLKRTIRAVTWKEAEKYRPCSRCGDKER